MKNFYNTIKKTFYSQELYAKAKTEPVSVSLKFLFKFILLLTVVFSIVALVCYFVFAPKVKTLALNYIQNEYPEDLIITIKDKTLITNKKEPVVFAIPQGINTEKEKGTYKNNLLVLNPKEKLSDISLLEKYDSYAVATEKSIIAYKNGIEYRTYLLDFKNAELTKTTFTEVVTKVLKYIPLIFIFIIPAIFFLTVGTTIKYFVLLAFISLLIFVFARKQENKLTYQEIYKMGIYSIIPVFLIAIVLSPFNFNFPLNGLVMMFFIYLSMGFFQKKTETVAPSTIDESTQ